MGSRWEEVRLKYRTHMTDVYLSLSQGAKLIKRWGARHQSCNHSGTQCCITSWDSDGRTGVLVDGVA